MMLKSAEFKAADRPDVRLPVLLGCVFLAVGAVGFALMVAGAGAATHVVSIDILTTGWILWILGVVGSLITIISPVFLVVGAGLVRRAPWARPLAFAVAIMSVFSFPIGTLLALATFAVLSRSDTKRLFDTPSGPGPSLIDTGAAGNTAHVSTTRPPDADRPAPRLETGDRTPSSVVSLTYHVGLDDLVAFAEYHTAHSPAVRRTHYWSLGIGSITVLVLLWVIGLRAAGGWPGAVVALFGWVVYLNWRTRSANRRYYRQVYSEGENRGTLGLHRLSADADGLTVTNDVTNARTRWSGIERIAEAPGFAFIYTGALEAYLIPEQRVVDGNFREFVDMVRRLRADASNAKQSA